MKKTNYIVKLADAMDLMDKEYEANILDKVMEHHKNENNEVNIEDIEASMDVATEMQATEVEADAKETKE